MRKHVFKPKLDFWTTCFHPWGLDSFSAARLVLILTHTCLQYHMTTYRRPTGPHESVFPGRPQSGAEPHTNTERAPRARPPTEHPSPTGSPTWLSESTLQVTFKKSPLVEEFWWTIEEHCQQLSEKAIKIYPPFQMSYLCEAGFFSLHPQNRLNIEAHMRILSAMKSDIKEICQSSQLFLFWKLFTFIKPCLYIDA